MSKWRATGALRQKCKATAGPACPRRKGRCAESDNRSPVTDMADQSIVSAKAGDSAMECDCLTNKIVFRAASHSAMTFAMVWLFPVPGGPSMSMM